MHDRAGITGIAVFDLYDLHEFLVSKTDAQQPNQQLPPNQLEMMQNVQLFTTYYFGVVGAAILLIGLLRMVSGVMAFQFRGRTLGIASHILGMVSVLSCYCLPTAIAVGVYGCIVYFNREVAHAFEMKKSGSSVTDILGFFNH